jgi:hypothetical protein
MSCSNLITQQISSSVHSCTILLELSPVKAPLFTPKNLKILTGAWAIKVVLLYASSLKMGKQI